MQPPADATPKLPRHTVETRSYRIVELLGSGGFGKVYRARMDGPSGFSKEVAIKLLTERNPPEDVLRRFRDESRVLGLVRDRAIVGVEPPTQLGGRWAVIMEYVPGVSCHGLLKKHGAFPPRVAFELIQEVARALDHVFRQPGPDGQPLELVHRDLKPANLQVTRAGELKILDFGVARARFDTREATTTHAIQGTYGFIAPERLLGQDTPACDVYSLGMVLFKLLTNGPTDPKAVRPASETATEELRAGLELALHMMSPLPEDRPTGREVEDRCAALARTAPGLELRRWAETHVHAASEAEADELVGKLLTSTLEIREPPSSDITAGRSTGWVLLAGITGVNVLLVVGGLSVVAVALVIAIVLTWTPASEPTAPVTTPVEILPPLAPAPAAPLPDPAVEPGPAPDPRPPTPRAAPSSPAPAAATLPIDFGSQPLGADVLLDGKRIGTTPLFGYAVPLGRHKVTMRAAGQSASIDIDVGKRKPRRFVWTGGEAWEVLY